MLVLLVALVYGVMLLFVFLYQNHLLFLPNLPSRQVETTPAEVGLAYEPVTLTTSDHIELDAWFLPAAAARGVILFCHGNAGNISHRLDSLLIFHRLGFSTLIFDYRGYGRSQGTPTEAGTYADAEAAWQYLVEERHIDPGRIVLFGRSLGAAVAAQLATVHRPGALIIESCFTSVPDMAAQLYPLLPARLLSRLNYNVLDYVQQVSCPLLVVHSPDDEIIPFNHGERIFAAARSAKMFLELKGGHNEGFFVTGEAYVKGLADFLEGFTSVH
ncbi:MAG: alpha/beta hydrolase [Proteobacteria bacterium]|nr:alpha/beta hydrolase [Pseudomonadota bacterium]MBU1639649.1 alpha/beta hydrolase [Pseudomonadota bacterium]